MEFQCPGGVSVEEKSDQNRAIAVCYALRMLESLAPSALISLKTSAHSLLSKGGGPGGRFARELCAGVQGNRMRENGEPGRTYFRH
jgi:hypothetical protein